jgi:hypothetical protein
MYASMQNTKVAKFFHVAQHMGTVVMLKPNMAAFGLCGFSKRCVLYFVVIVIPYTILGALLA